MSSVEIPDPSALPRADEVLTKAVLRAADRLELSQAALADVLGVTAPQVSRLRKGSRALSPSSRAVWDRALLFVRLYRSLDALWSGSDAASRAWLRSDNAALGAPPVELLRGAEGLVRVLHYLDAMRAKV